MSDAEHRRERLLKAGIPQEWISHYFKATDLRGDNGSVAQKYVDNLAINHLYGAPLRPAEIGCAMSHIGAYKWLASSEFDLMLVLEDDILPRSNSHIADLQSICTALALPAHQGHAFICHLGVENSYFRHGKVRGVKFPDGRRRPDIVLHSDKGRDIWLAHAYLISKSAALRISNQGDIKCLADDFLSFLHRGAIENIFVAKPAIYDQDNEIMTSVQLGAPRSRSGRRNVRKMISKTFYRAQNLFTHFFPYNVRKS
ncbi:glycosyltransferase family 25 protein [Ochrobactrum sp. A-1]|nr:glycosyltransferase family 25 protein [Ochrobactrum sp. A-1]